MIKRILVIGAGAVVLVVLLFGLDAYSYIGTAVDKAHQTVKASVPVEFELDRAQKMIKDLAPEISRNMHLIAKEEVDVARLEKQVNELQAKIEKEREQIFRLKGDLESGQGSFVYAGRSYTETQVRNDLTNRFSRFKTNEVTLEKLQKVLDARRRGLDAAREKLEGMLAARRELEVDVANLEARKKMIDVAQTTSEFQFDESHLARTKELIADIQTRLDVSERLLDADTQLHDQIPLDEAIVADDITEQIETYFAGEQPAPLPVETVAQTK